MSADIQLVEKKKEPPYDIQRVTNGLREWKFGWMMTFAEMVIEHLRQPSGPSEPNMVAPPRAEEIVALVEALLRAADDLDNRTAR